MKICIVGAGAIGGMLGVKLALTGHDVTLILRGANLQAVQQNGLTLIEENGTELLAKPIKATADMAQAGVQDLIILVLMDHPAVAQVVTFGMPHDKLGEEVAAAVVLREGHTATDREIREFVATKLADFKVPRKILIMDEIPKGATGKLQRIGLAQKLGLTA